MGERGLTRRRSVRMTTSSPVNAGRIARPAHDHANRGIDLATAQIQTAVELAIELLEHRSGGVRGLRFAADGHQVAARREGHGQVLLDQGEMLVMPAEQHRTARVVLEAQGS